MKHALCSCGASIVFARNVETGKLIPLEASPISHAYSLENPELRDGPGMIATPARVYISHFIRCPDRERYSGRNR